MKTIVWRPGTPNSNIRPTTAQQGRPFTSAGVGTGVQLDGELIASVPDTLVVAAAGDVYRQVLAWGGDCELVIDTTLGAAALPAGMVLPGFGVDPTTGAALTSGPALLHIRGARPGTALSVPDTAQILGVGSLTDMNVTCVAGTVQGIGIGKTFAMVRSLISNTAASLIPVIKTEDSYAGVFSFEASGLDNSAAAAHPIIQLGTTGADPGATVSIWATDTYSNATNAITAAVAAAASVLFLHDASVFRGYFAAQNVTLAAGGGVTDVPLGSAATVAYTPAVGADWVNPDPTTVGAAIDRIAAVLAAGGGGVANPIP